MQDKDKQAQEEINNVPMLNLLSSIKIPLSGSMNCLVNKVTKSLLQQMNW